MKCFVALVVVLTAVAFASYAAATEKKKETKEWKVPARAAGRANPVPADERSLATGKNLYVKECADCHGGKGRGDGAGARDLEAKMPDLTDPKLWKQTDGALFFKITEGREPMPSTEELSEEQRWHLVNYVRTFAPKPREGHGDDSQPAKGK